MEDLPCAIEHGEEAGRRQGDSEEVLFTLGRIYLVAKKHDEAEKTFQHICEEEIMRAGLPRFRAKRTCHSAFQAKRMPVRIAIKFAQIA
jgi:hypothetical protein